MASSHLTIGSGERQVLALHGWFGSARGWGPLPDYLNGDDYTWAFMDLRGYGSRKGETGEFTMREAAADALALADELGWERFSLVGHSMTGQAIQHALLARRTGSGGWSHHARSRRGYPVRRGRVGAVLRRGGEPGNRAAIINFTTGSRLTPAFVDHLVQHSRTNRPSRRSAPTWSRGPRTASPSRCRATRPRSRSSWGSTTRRCPPR